MKGIATPATIADHVESHRGDWSAFLTGKLQSLCARCHDSLKKLHDRRQRLDAPWGLMLLSKRSQARILVW
jgi:hypothetical protein